MSEELVGSVSHYFNKAGVIAIEMTGELAVGDAIHVIGHLTDFTETVASMQIEHEPVTRVKPGDSVGIKVAGKAREGDDVYRVLPG
ncbi:MAG: translation elongation factor-like protein [Actinobacteria bacterium]|nr:translation elongation factor-like protein [Actinomycetota bacterium]